MNGKAVHENQNPASEITPECLEGIKQEFKHFNGRQISQLRGAIVDPGVRARLLAIPGTDHLYRKRQILRVFGIVYLVLVPALLFVLTHHRFFLPAVALGVWFLFVAPRQVKTDIELCARLVAFERLSRGGSDPGSGVEPSSPK